MRILAFFAHPDDETILAGGSLAFLARQGAEVHYLSATRGEGGEVGEPPLCAIEELGAVRERELACAVQTLGGKSLSFLDYIDPRVGPDEALFPYTDQPAQLAEQIAAKIQRLGIQAVITHGSNGEYGHPAHVLSHQATRLAISSLGEGDHLLYTVSAMYPDHPRPRLANQDDEAHLVLDVTPTLPQKIQAALCHRTQHALFVRRSSQEAGRQLSVPEVIHKYESLHRVYPPQNSGPEDGLTDLLRPIAHGTPARES